MTALLADPLTRLLAQITAIVVVSRVLGLVLRRIGQPMVIAEMTAGILLGPSVLGALAPDATAALFATTSLGLMHLVSQVGLILFMFLVGLELDPGLLRGRGKTSIAISHSSIAVPFLLGLGIAYYLQPRHAADVPMLAFALFMGVAMSITAFPVLARILTERRLMRTKIGAIAIACAAVDDVTAWCMLAFVVAAARSTGLYGAAQTTVLALGFLGVMILMVRPVLARMAARVSEDGAPSQNVVAVVIILVFLAAVTSERIGIHALFGAFLFGAVMPKEGGLAGALASRLEDLILIVFLPLFFAVSGLRTEIGLLATPAAWLDCALVIALACLGKFGGTMLAGRLTGLSYREAGALGVLMNTRGLMELVVLNVGLDLGVISPTVFSMMVLMALFTTFMTTPILGWIYPAEWAASEALAEQAPIAPADHPAAYTVMLCVAHEGAGPNLVAMAGALTAGRIDQRIYALHLVPSPERASSMIADDEDEVGEEALAPALERARQLGVAVLPLAFGSAAPARDICEVAEARAVDLIVMGWHRPVLGQSLLGGVVGGVLDDARGTIGVFVDRGLGAIRRILVPFRGSANDCAALELAARLAESGGVTLVALRVARPGHPGSRRDRPPTSAPHPSAELKVVEHESPIDAVLEESRGRYDLVVVGADREWGLGDPLFGITLQGERVMVDCQTSVLVVRARRGPSRPDRPIRAAEVDDGWAGG